MGAVCLVYIVCFCYFFLYTIALGAVISFFFWFLRSNVQVVASVMLDPVFGGLCKKNVSSVAVSGQQVYFDLTL